MMRDMTLRSMASGNEAKKDTHDLLKEQLAKRRIGTRDARLPPNPPKKEDDQTPEESNRK